MCMMLILVVSVLATLALIVLSIALNRMATHCCKTRCNPQASWSTFILARHGYRSPAGVTPQRLLQIGAPVVPSFVPMPSFGAAYEGTLFNRTLSHTLSSVVHASLGLNTKTSLPAGSAYADSAFSRCWQTAVGWAELIDAKTICGVTTTANHPVDPRVNHHPAEVNVTNVPQWISDQQSAAAALNSSAQNHWSE